MPLDKKKKKKRIAREYDPTIPIDVYQLALDGYNDLQISGALGVTYTRFQAWRGKYKAVRAALERAREIRKKNSNKQDKGAFANYVFQKLPSHLKKLWNDIMAVGDDLDAIDAIFRKKGIRARQQLYLHALTVTLFDPSLAAAKVGLSLSQVKKWMKDPDFAAMVEEIHEHKKNFVESALMVGVANGDKSMVIFANETLNADRGYNKKKIVDVDVSGKISHEHAHVNIDELGLPLETKKRILAALRKNEGVKNLGHNSTQTSLDAQSRLRPQDLGGEDDYGYLEGEVLAREEVA